MIYVCSAYSLSLVAYGLYYSLINNLLQSYSWEPRDSLIGRSLKHLCKTICVERCRRRLNASTSSSKLICKAGRSHILSHAKQTFRLEFEETEEWLRTFTAKCSRLSEIYDPECARFGQPQLRGIRGSGFSGLSTSYMCQWLRFNRVMAQLALNKHSAMLLGCSFLLDTTMKLKGGATECLCVCYINP